MVINDFHIIRMAVMPRETDTPLKIDSDAVLSFAVPMQCFKMIAWRNPQSLQYDNCVKHIQFPQCNPFKCFESAASPACFQLFRLFAFETFYHVETPFFMAQYISFRVKRKA